MVSNYLHLAPIFLLLLPIVENSLFSTVSTTERPVQNERVLFEDQLHIFKSLTEAKFLLERFEVKMTQMQKTLDKLVTLHDAELNKISKSSLDEDGIIAKIENIVEQKLKIYNFNAYNKSQTEDTTKQILEFGKALQQIKVDLTNEINDNQKEQSKVLSTSLENVKREITENIITEIKSADDKLNADKTQLEETKKLIAECEKKLQEESRKHQRDVNPPKNCRELLKQGKQVSDVYYIQPNPDTQPFQVFCDMETRGGGWIYVLNRFDGSQDFYLNWTDYKQGFGKLTGEFWLGLEHLHQLTRSDSELLFELTDWEEKTVYALFTNFRVGSEREGYAIELLGDYSGDAGSSFVNHKGYQFYTLDSPTNSKKDCVSTYHGPWWYGDGCFHAKLTGKYLKGNIVSYADGIHWADFHGYKYSLKRVKMMVRP